MATIRLFSKDGQTYIGKVGDVSDISIAASAILKTATDVTSLDDSTYVYVQSPAVIDFGLTKIDDTNAKISWKITPLCYGKLLSTSANNWWRFKKEDIVFSSVTEDSFNEKTLVSAYKALI